MTEPSPRHFTYGQVEAAIASIYIVSQEELGSFRGRIKHFQRLGVVPKSPGKGRKISYELEDIYKWALCFEFAEFGIDPSAIKITVDLMWPKTRVHLLAGHGAEADEFLVFSRSFLRRECETAVPPFGIFFDVVSDARRVQTALARFGAINLSELRHRVESALSDAETQ